MSSVDVVVPCYRYGRFLRECVESVLSQPGVNVRILIIDDASPDNTAEVAAELANEDQRVNFVRHSTNKGHISTYNEGIEWASADYFLLLSADDLLLPRALKRASTIMDENSDVVLTHGHCIAWNDKFPFPHGLVRHTVNWERQDCIKEMCAAGDTVVYTPTAIVRTSAQKRIGGYLESLPHCADLELWLRFAIHGTVAYIPATQAIYRMHTSAMSRSYSSTVFGCKQRRQAFDTFFKAYEGYLKNTHRLRTKAQKKAARLTFSDGIDHLRRGRISIGLQLLYLSIDQDPQLKFFPPFWRLFRLPGPEGRSWMASVARRATMRLVRGA